MAEGPMIEEDGSSGSVPCSPGYPGSGAETPVQSREHLGMVPEGQNKPKTRQRLLRSLQRISSSPTLAQFGRSRSQSASSRLYGGPATYSCASLAPTPMSVSQSGAGSSVGYFDYTSTPNSVPGTPFAITPYLETPGHDGIESVLAIRKVDPAAVASTSIAMPADVRSRKRALQLWTAMPHEVKIHIFSYLQPKELVRASRVSRDFYKTCFDGQLWTSLDASEFYTDIPADSLAKIILLAGPFVKDLNLRGCVQVEHYKRAEVMVKSCKNLMNATFEGCRNFQKTTLHNLVQNNERLVRLNLAGLTAVTNTTCKLIAQSCAQLEMLNVSWCKHMDARGVRAVVEGCPNLKDLRAGEIRGFDNTDVALTIFKTNNLERLVLAGCEDITDNALRVMMQGIDPEMDILYDVPLVPARKLRHLDLSRCNRLTTPGVKALAHVAPELEGLQLSGVTNLTDSALEGILASTPRLTHLELEDLLNLTNSILSEHLAKAPCAPILERLSVSYCESISDAGMIPLLRACTSLRSIDADNTRISDLSLAEAAAAVRSRPSSSSPSPSPPAKTPSAKRQRPVVGLSMVVYDCSHITWTGVKEILRSNAEAVGRSAGTAAPAEIIALKCFYGWQMTADEHTKRVLRGDFLAAGRLERKWADYMQANEEAGAGGSGGRRRRRRAREAELLHANETQGRGPRGAAGGRRRAMTAACAVM